MRIFQQAYSCEWYKRTKVKYSPDIAFWKVIWTYLNSARRNSLACDKPKKSNTTDLQESEQCQQLSLTHYLSASFSCDTGFPPMQIIQGRRQIFHTKTAKWERSQDFVSHFKNHYTHIILEKRQTLLWIPLTFNKNMWSLNTAQMVPVWRKPCKMTPLDLHILTTTLNIRVLFQWSCNI